MLGLKGGIAAQTAVPAAHTICSEVPQACLTQFAVKHHQQELENDGRLKSNPKTIFAADQPHLVFMFHHVCKCDILHLQIQGRINDLHNHTLLKQGL
jgi:hypothetical protein